MRTINVGLICLLILGVALSFGLVSATVKNIAPGGDVFIGEQNLNVSAGVGGNQYVSWYMTGQTPGKSTPSFTVFVSNKTSFSINPASFTGYTGKWYAGSTANVAFNVVDPSIAIVIWDQNNKNDITGKSVPDSHFVNFRIDSNLYNITKRPGFDPSNDGFIQIKVKGPDGTTYSVLFQSTKVSVPLTNLVVNTQPYYWVTVNNPKSGWNTTVTNANGIRLYPAGVYSIWAVTDVNGIEDNYKDNTGADYVGKTVSALQTIIINQALPSGTSSSSWANTNNLLKNLSKQTSGSTVSGSGTGSFQGSVTLPLKTFNASSNGMTVSLRKNDVIAIQLAENPSTGFSWNVSISKGILILQDAYKGSQQLIPSQFQMTGAGGTHTWTLQMVSNGTQQFKGTYKQPWMPPSSNSDQTFILTFKVTN